MSGTTAIEWAEKVWNPVVGCAKVSPGCAHCYAETMANRLRGMARADLRAGRDPGRKRHYLDVVDDAGRWNGTVRFVPEALDEPLGWAKPCRVFVNSMSDLFHEGLPDEYVLRVFDVMRRCTRAGGQNGGRIGGSGHTFQVLTKRAARMCEFVSRLSFDGTRYALADAAPGRGLRGNPQIWLGVSAEDQARADGRVPLLLETPAAVRFLSLEPLLGPVDLGSWFGYPASPAEQAAMRSVFPHGLPVGSLNEALSRRQGQNRRRLHWVIVGGESGPGARRMDPSWALSLMNQCRGASVPCFFKQAGSVLAREWHCRDAKGGDPAEWPSDLRVREFPEARPVQAEAFAPEDDGDGVDHPDDED